MDWGSLTGFALSLTMAIIDGMVVRVGGQRYIVPTLNIERSFRPTKEQLTMVLQKGELVRVREELLPIYRIHRLFNVREGAQDLAGMLCRVVFAGAHAEQGGGLGTAVNEDDDRARSRCRHDFVEHVG